MTSEEKKQITQLRKRGCTYQEISQETGLALSTVKMHFQRMKPTPNTEYASAAKSPLGRMRRGRKSSAPTHAEPNGGGRIRNSSATVRNTYIPARFAGKSSMRTGTPNTAPVAAITSLRGRPVKQMPKPDVTGYLSAMTLAGRLLDRGLIARKEFASFEEKIRVRYGLDKTSIYRDHRLLCVPARANITHCQEVVPWKSK